MAKEQEAPPMGCTFTAPAEPYTTGLAISELSKSVHATQYIIDGLWYMVYSICLMAYGISKSVPKLLLDH